MKRDDEPVPQFTSTRPRVWRHAERRQGAEAAKKTFSEIVFGLFETAIEFVVQLLIGMIEGLFRHW